MSVSATIEQHLQKAGVAWDVIRHDHTEDSMSTARATHVSGESMVKAVVLKDDKGYLMAVMPASCKLSESDLHHHFGRHLELAEEPEIIDLFVDCDPGAIPPVPAAYGMEAVWDDSLLKLRDVYFEGGDHDSVVHVNGEDFLLLMGDARHAHFSHHQWDGRPKYEM